MALMAAGLYEALKDAGAKDTLAKKAAEEVADFEATANEIKSDLKLLKWMVGFVLAVVLALLMQSFGG